MIASGVLVLVALISLVIGWGPGPDALLFVSMVASVAAGVLLVMSFLKERKLRKEGAESSVAGPITAPAPAQIEADLRALDRPSDDEDETELYEPVPVAPASATAEMPASPLGGGANAWDRAWAGMIHPEPAAEVLQTQPEEEPAVVLPEAPAGAPGRRRTGGGLKPKAAGARKPAARKPAARKPAVKAKASARPKPAVKPKAKPKPAAKAKSNSKPKPAAKPKASAKPKTAARPRIPRT